jgi:protein-disulfide isomerase
MARLLEQMTNVASLGAGLAAVVVAAVVLHRTFGPDVSPRGQPQKVSGWQRYAGGGHRLGPETAAVTIIEFGDYECPFCREAEPHLAAIRSRYGDEVALVYRHFPLPLHAAAFPAARAAECAGQQDRFWEFHSLLYSTDSWIKDTSEAGLTALADQADVPSVDEFASCLEGVDADYAVNADLAAGQGLGIQGTPTFLINGELHVGVLDSLRFERLFEELHDDPP